MLSGLVGALFEWLPLLLDLLVLGTRPAFGLGFPRPRGSGTCDEGLDLSRCFLPASPQYFPSFHL